MSTEHRIRPTIEAPVTALGLVVEDIAVTPAGRRRLVRISLDRDVSGLDPADDRSPVASLTLDEVAEATRAVSAALDESDALGSQPYVLEVTSPGVDRVLTEPRHFRRNVTRLVHVARTDGTELTGRLAAAGGEALTLAVEATRAAPRSETTIRYDDIERAHVQVEFARSNDESARSDDESARSDDEEDH